METTERLCLHDNRLCRRPVTHYYAKDGNRVEACVKHASWMGNLLGTPVHSLDPVDLLRLQETAETAKTWRQHVANGGD